MRNWLFALVIAIALAGCGGSDSAETGRAVFTVVWPSSRLIPEASQSIRVEIRRNNAVVAAGVVPRPVGGGPASVTFQNLPVGAVTAIATAHPNADGTGVAQASGSVGFTVLAGQTTPFTLTMASTIDRIEVNPPDATLDPGQNQQLSVTARNASNQIVLISAGKLSWQSLNTNVATVDSNGRVTAQNPGSAQIRVTETESGQSAIATIEVEAQPVSWWKGEGNANDSAGVNHGVPCPGSSFAPGVVGQAFSFDGVDDAFCVPDSDSLKITGSLTIDAWIHPLSVPTPGPKYHMALFRGDIRFSTDPYFLGLFSDGRLHFSVASLTERVEIDGPIQIGQWQRVTGTLNDATGEMKLFVNGIVVAETVTTVRPLRDLDPAQYPGIGIGDHSEAPRWSHPYAFHGLIDELKLYNAVVPPN